MHLKIFQSSHSNCTALPPHPYKNANIEIFIDVNSIKYDYNGIIFTVVKIFQSN